MLQTKTASFLANTSEEVVAITQLSTNITTLLGAYTLWSLLDTDFSNTDKKTIYCSIAKMEITLGSNMHLSSAPGVINTYLTKGFNQELKNYILENFPNIEKPSEILSQNNKVTSQRSQKFSEIDKKEIIKNFPIIKMAEYAEPNYDDANCNGYPNVHFIGIEGNNGETIEISFKAHEDLFDPDGEIIKNYLVGNGFNLYDNNRKNLAYENNIALICTHNKSKATFKIKLISAVDRKYFGTKIKKHQPIIIANGRLPEPIKYKSNISQLVGDEPIQTEVLMTNNADEELPW